MIADARKIEIYQLLHLEKLLPLYIAQDFEVRIVGRVNRRATQIVIPVGTGFNLHLFSR